MVLERENQILTGDINEKCIDALRRYYAAARNVRNHLIKGAAKPGQPYQPGMPADDARLFGFTTGITLDDAIKLIAPMAKELKKELLVNIEGTIEVLGMFTAAAA